MKFNLGRIISIIIIFFLILTLWYFYELNESSKKNIEFLMTEKGSLEKKLTVVYKERKDLELQLAGMAKERDSLTEKIGDYENRMQTVTAEIEKLKSDTAARDEEIAKKGSEVEALKGKIGEYEKAISVLKQKIAQQALAVPPSAPAAESVALKPITVIPSKSKKLDAKIVDFNKEYYFVVINAGKEQGIQEEDTLFVYRKNNLLGKVVVERVGDNVCVAKILYKSLADNVRKGDLISY